MFHEADAASTMNARSVAAWRTVTEGAVSSMTEKRSLTERFRERMDLRKLEDTRVDAMVADVKRIRTEIHGLNSIGNLALGNSRAAVEDVETMKAEVLLMREEIQVLREVILVQADTITGLQKEAYHQADRMENMAQWAKTKGKR